MRLRGAVGAWERMRRAPVPAGCCARCWADRRPLTPGLACLVGPGPGQAAAVPIILCGGCLALVRRLGLPAVLALPDAPDPDALLEAVASAQAPIAERSALTLRKSRGA